MGQKFKILEVISREDLPLLEDFCREPGRTIDEAHEWLEAHGYQVSRTGVSNWLRNFTATDRFGTSGQVARAIKEAAKVEGVADISDAAMLQLSQLIFETCLKAQSDGKIEPRDLGHLANAIDKLATGKRKIDELREKFDQQIAEKSKAKSGDAAGTITQDDIDQVRKAIFG